MKKTFFLDTNVLLSDTNSLYSFEDNDLVIPLTCLEELDRNKTRMDEIGRAGREMSRLLDELRSTGNLNEGVPLRTGGTLRICSLGEKKKDLPFEISDLTKGDNAIIATVLGFAEKNKNETVILVSKDINVRIKCDALGIISQDYLKMRIIEDQNVFYKGTITLSVPKDVIDQYYMDGYLDLVSLDKEMTDRICENQFVTLKSSENESTSAMTKRVKSRLIKCQNIEHAFGGLRPRNLEQKYALDLLFDDNINLVTLIGASGTGKTLLAVAAGMQQVLDPVSGQAKYDKLIITRPVQPVGRDIGFLPGTLQEKMEPWIAPIKDNISFLCENSSKPSHKHRNDSSYLDLLIKKGQLEIEAITFIRGRSIPNAYIIIDEAQNLSLHELKTIITRVGDGTKIVLTGDLEQIDNTHVDVYTSGLTYAVERFKEYEISGHVTLTKGERSPLATLASKIL
jgi:PhoH-like ATPase